MWSVFINAAAWIGKATLYVLRWAWAQPLAASIVGAGAIALARLARAEDEREANYVPFWSEISQIVYGSVETIGFLIAMTATVSSLVDVAIEEAAGSSFGAWLKDMKEFYGDGARWLFGSVSI